MIDLVYAHILYDIVALYSYNQTLPEKTSSKDEVFSTKSTLSGG